MNRTLLMMLAGASLCLALASAERAEAHERGRHVDRGPHGARVAVHRSNAAFDSGRQRSWHADHRGNAHGSRSGYYHGAGGTDVDYRRSAYRHADGSAGRQGSTRVHGRRGGYLDTSGSLARDADGQVSGSRNTTIVGRDGKRYDGSTSIVDGTLTHTRSCSNAAGEPVSCR